MVGRHHRTVGLHLYLHHHGTVGGLMHYLHYWMAVHLRSSGYNIGVVVNRRIRHRLPSHRCGMDLPHRWKNSTMQ